MEQKRKGDGRTRPLPERWHIPSDVIARQHTLERESWSPSLVNEQNIALVRESLSVSALTLAGNDLFVN